MASFVAHNPNVFASRAEALASLTASLSTCKCSPCEAGSLACQKDSYLREISSLLLASAIYREEVTAKAAKGKKKKKATPDDVAKSGNSKVLLVFEDSVFFPAGGGQPCDRGTVSISDGTSFDVIDVENAGGVAVLTVDIPSSPHVAEIVLKFVSAEEKVSQKIDWALRFDHIVQHSGQHLISAIAMEPEFDFDTMSWSLQAGLTSYIDFSVDPETPIEEQVNKFKKIEAMCNDKIRSNLSMTPMWMYPEDPEFQKKVRSRLLPEGLNGKLRLVEIDGIDCNTCCGTHVPTLSHLQMVKFFKFSKIKSNLLRVSYAVGERLVDIMEESFTRQCKITGILTVNESGHVETVNKLIDEKKSNEKEIKALNQKLVDLQIKGIIEEAKSDKVSEQHHALAVEQIKDYLLNNDFICRSFLRI